MPGLARVNGAAGRWMPLLVVGSGVGQLGWGVLYV